MPIYIRCGICGKRSPKRWGFKKRMAWLRRHRKKKHPKAHRASIRKATRSRKQKRRRRR